MIIVQNSVGDSVPLTDITHSYHQEECDKLGYELKILGESSPVGGQIKWSKLVALKKVMIEEGLTGQTLNWRDSDSIKVKKHLFTPIPQLPVNADVSIIQQGNTGCFLVRSCQKIVDFFDLCISKGPVDGHPGGFGEEMRIHEELKNSNIKRVIFDDRFNSWGRVRTDDPIIWSFHCVPVNQRGNMPAWLSLVIKGNRLW